MNLMPMRDKDMLDAKNKIDETPSHEAAERCQMASITVLKKHGADLDIKNERGETPRDEAIEEGCPEEVIDILTV